MTDEIIPTETLNKTFMLVPHWRIDVDGWTEEACAAHFEKKHGKPAVTKDRSYRMRRFAPRLNGI